MPVKDIADDTFTKIIKSLKKIEGKETTLEDKMTILEELKNHLLSGIRKILISDPDPVEFSNLKHLLTQKLDQVLSIGHGHWVNHTNPEEFLLVNSTSREILSKALFWLEDELILVFPKKRLERFKQHVSHDKSLRIKNTKDGKWVDDEGWNDNGYWFDIEFKSEVTGGNELSTELVSLVVQCMVVVCHQTGAFYTLHDRSYSGAEDRTSKYALITGRLSVDDLLPHESSVDSSVTLGITNGQIKIDSLCREHALRRELQEIDELGLPENLAIKYTDGYVKKKGPDEIPRYKFIDVYQDKAGKILSFLYTIFVTVDEYNTVLTKRGPYLIPVNPKEFSKLKTLNLLNDILDKNSCVSCEFTEISDIKSSNCEKCDQKEVCSQAHQQEKDSCIIFNIAQKMDKFNYFELFDKYDGTAHQNQNIEKFKPRLKSDAAIIALHIPGYSLLSTEGTLEIREQLERLIYSFLPMYEAHRRGYQAHINTTPKGYAIILKKCDQDEESKSIKLALIAYFFSIYLSMKLSHFEKWQNGRLPEIRIGLHTDNLKVKTSLNVGIYFPGNGINKAFHIMSFGQKKQILCSQNFAMQLLSEIEASGTQIEADFEGDRIRSLRKKKPGGGIWNNDDDDDDLELSKLLDSLKIPPVVVMEICQDKNITSCFQDQGLSIRDFGSFTEENRPRHRVFNLGIFNSKSNQPATPDQKGELSDYGNVEQPLARIPIKYRNESTTTDELEKLTNSLEYAQHLTIYGYSNVRVMKEIYKKYIGDSAKNELESLMDLKIVFYDYNQYKDINETKPIKLTKAHWLLGFLYANEIAQQLRKKKINVKIAINDMRYGFNVFKVSYAIKAPSGYKDHIRFTVPMPGEAFELSPVFIINRGDPLYHDFLGICERHIEQGIKENSDDISIKEYKPNADGKKRLKELFEEIPPEINKISKIKEDLKNGKIANSEKILSAIEDNLEKKESLRNGEITNSKEILSAAKSKEILSAINKILEKKEKLDINEISKMQYDKFYEAAQKNFDESDKKLITEYLNSLKFGEKDFDTDANKLITEYLDSLKRVEKDFDTDADAKKLITEYLNLFEYVQKKFGKYDNEQINKYANKLIRKDDFIGVYQLLKCFELSKDFDCQKFLEEEFGG